MSYRALKLGGGVVAALVGLEVAGYGPFSRSSGVRNIEKSWSRGGGGVDHTPAIASKLGDYDNVVGDHGHQGGYGNATMREKIAEMKPADGNVVVGRKKRTDTNTPGGSGLAAQKADQKGETIKEPLSPISASKSKQ